MFKVEPSLSFVGTVIDQAVANALGSWKKAAVVAGVVGATVVVAKKARARRRLSK